MFAFSRRTLFRGGFNRFINTMAEQQQRRADIVDNLRNVRTAMENAGTPQKVKRTTKIIPLFFPSDQYSLVEGKSIALNPICTFFFYYYEIRLD